MVSRYEDIGFHAVGRGAAMAQQAGAILSHVRMTERPVTHGALAAVRVLDALTVTSPSVGGPMDACAITASGARSLGDEQVGELRQAPTGPGRR